MSENIYLVNADGLRWIGAHDIRFHGVRSTRDEATGTVRLALDYSVLPPVLPPPPGSIVKMELPNDHA